MNKNDNRKIFLNVRTTLENEEGVSNIDNLAEDKFYSLCCDICDGNRLALGISKTEGIAFAKASIKINGLTDDQVSELCNPIIGDNTQISYSININKIVFQVVIPIQKQEFEENNELMFSELRNFVIIVTKCSKKLGYGDVIYLSYKEYEKKNNHNNNESSINNVTKNSESQDDVMKIKPDAYIPKDTPIKVSDVDDNEELSDFSSMGVMKVEDMENEMLFAEEMNGTIPVDDIEEMEEINKLDKGENITLNGDMSDLYVDNSSSSEEEEYTGIVSDEDVASDDKKEEKETKVERPKITNRWVNNKSDSDKNNNENAINDNTKQIVETSDIVTESKDIPIGKPLRPHSPNQDKTEKIESIKPSYENKNNTVINEDKENNVEENTTKPYEKQQDVTSVDNKSNNKSKNKENDKMDDRKNFQNNNQKGNIFLNYERDLKNIENKYRNQIKNLSFDDLLKMIENRYNQCYDTNGAIIEVSDYSKEKLCNVAKEELRNRMK